MQQVISQPSRPVGRGQKLNDPPVVVWARAHQLAIRQPSSLKDAHWLAELVQLSADVAVVVAFGRIFHRELLQLPRLGCLNLHGSLLPHYRGAAPIQAALLHGDAQTGVTTMQMAPGLDTGPLLLQQAVAIGPEETAGELAERLSQIGAQLMVRTLDQLAYGTLVARPQDESQVSYAPRLDKSAGVVDWGETATALWHRLRALTPWPGLTSELRGQPLKLIWARPVSFPELSTLVPGSLLGVRDDRLIVACGSGTFLGLEKVQRPGKKVIAARDLANGEHLRPGERFQ